MGKRGPKPQPGVREASGRLDRRTHTERLNELSRRQQQEIVGVVLAQPHRRLRDGALTDKRLSFAAGRFCRLYGLDSKILSACEEFAASESRWLSGWGKPAGHERHEGGSGSGPTKEQMDKWLSKIQLVERAIRKAQGNDALIIVRRLLLEDMDITTEDHMLVRAALCEIGVALEWIKRNPHPFTK